MPSGTVTRIIFGWPSGSNSCTTATGMPFSSRPTLVMTQTFFSLVSLFLPHILIQGEYISSGLPFSAGFAETLAAGAGFFLLFCASAGGAANRAVAAITATIAAAALSARPQLG